MIAWHELPARVNADAIPGASFAEMDGLGHFPMCEDPDRFLAQLQPVLEKIAAEGS